MILISEPRCTSVGSAVADKRGGPNLFILINDQQRIVVYPALF